MQVLLTGLSITSATSLSPEYLLYRYSVNIAVDNAFQRLVIAK